MSRNSVMYIPPRRRHSVGMRICVWLTAALWLCCAAVTRAQSGAPYILARVSYFGASNELVAVSRTDYFALVKEVGRDNAFMDKAYGEMRKEWVKRHDRMVTQTYTDKQGRQQEIKTKAPAPSFPLKRRPDRAVQALYQFADLAAAQAKKKELEDAEDAKDARNAMLTDDGTKKRLNPEDVARPGMAPVSLKRPDPPKKATGGGADRKRREARGYLTDDPSDEQLKKQLMDKFATVKQAAEKADKDLKGKQD